MVMLIDFAKETSACLPVANNEPEPCRAASTGGKLVPSCRVETHVLTRISMPSRSRPTTPSSHSPAGLHFEGASPDGSINCSISMASAGLRRSDAIPNDVRFSLDIAKIIGILRKFKLPQNTLVAN
ncbi:MAG TPA: hypothetical protein VKM55_01025 [Candidatus Lokiarchaeia archaeon]|nr:hypothetical protein [Candidatus Lokiarchaeia archaeon]